MKNKIKNIEERIEFNRKDVDNKIEADIERTKNWILTKTSKNQHRIDDLETNNVTLTNKLDMNIKNLDDQIDTLKRDIKNLNNNKLDKNSIDKINNDLNRIIKDF